MTVCSPGQASPWSPLGLVLSNWVPPDHSDTQERGGVTLQGMLPSASSLGVALCLRVCIEKCEAEKPEAFCHWTRTGSLVLKVPQPRMAMAKLQGLWMAVKEGGWLSLGGLCQPWLLGSPPPPGTLSCTVRSQ